MCHMTWLKTKLGALNEGVVQKASKIDIPEMDYHSFFYLCSEKNHPHLQASSRRGNKLKRRKAYYNRQRKDISVSWEMSK